jgi:primosomal protein N'
MKSIYRVGDRVKVPFGPRQVTGVVIEDRGPIGVRGRRLYQISIPVDPFEPETIEIAEDEIERRVGQAEADAEMALDTGKVLDFLKHGGLILILGSDRLGEQQPRVWLRPDTLGNVTYTFAQERGVVGGEAIPFRAVQDDRVLESKQDEVLAFLEGFGLTRREAESVLRSVGTSKPARRLHRDDRNGSRSGA